MTRAVPGATQSKWANPYPVRKHGRARCLALYERHVRDSPHLMNSLRELEGKMLGCWCKPLPCHGDVLVKLFKEFEVCYVCMFIFILCDIPIPTLHRINIQTDQNLTKFHQYFNFRALFRKFLIISGISSTFRNFCCVPNSCLVPHRGANKSKTIFATLIKKISKS